MSTPTALLEVKGLSKSYLEAGQRRPILRQVDLQIQPGEFVALLGSSGSGKSTFLNLISGIDLADEGEIWLQGQNLVAMNEAERTLFRRNHIGFVFQFFNLLPTLTVLENVTLPAELRGTPLKQAQQRAGELLAQVGLAGSPAASSSASPSPAPSRTTRCWCWPTSPLATWTKTPARRSWPYWRH